MSSTEPEALERQVREAFAAGSREKCLRALVRYHAALRRVDGTLALAWARVWLTALVAQAPVSPRATRRARDASQVLVASGRLNWACRALAQEGRLALLGEDWSRASQLLSTAHVLGSQVVSALPPSGWATLLRNLGHSSWQLGDVQGARRAWNEALSAAQAHDLSDITAAAHVGLALCDWDEGQPASGYVHCSTALSWLRLNGRLPEVAQVLCNAAMMLEDFGHWRDAAVLLCEARDIARKVGDRKLASDTNIELVHAYIALGEHPEAHAALEEARAVQGGPCPLPPRCAAELELAEGHLLLAEHRVDEALGRFREARVLIRDAHRPLLTQRVLTDLNLTIQTATGRLSAAREMMEVVQAMDRRSLAHPVTRPAPVPPT